MSSSFRILRSRKRQLLLSIIATYFVCGIESNLLTASDPDSANRSSPTQQEKSSNNDEPILRSAQPFTDASSNADGSSTGSTTLPFRKPAIKQTVPVTVSPEVKVPAMTVSNRTSTAVPSTAVPSTAPATTLAPTPTTTNRALNEGWVAREAVNLDQPLRDPGSESVVSPYDVPAYAGTSLGPVATVTPPPAYLGDRSVAMESQVTSGVPTNVTVDPAETAKTRPTLVLPKDRQPLLPPARNAHAPQTAPTPVAKSIDLPASAPMAEPPVEVKPPLEVKQDVKIGAIENEKTPAKEDSRVERILETLMPADGTAIGSNAIPASKSEKLDSVTSEKKPGEPELELRSPNTPKSANPSNQNPSEIASSKADEVAGGVIVRKLRIDSDGSIAGEKPATIVSSSQPRTASPTQSVVVDSASSYLGDMDPIQPDVLSPRPVSDISLDYIGLPTSPRQASYAVRRLQGGMSHVLNYFYQRPEKADERSNWGMLHSIMVYGTDTRVQAGNKKYSAIAWIAGNNFCRGQQLAEVAEDRIRIKSGVGLQGHQGQLLAVFSLSGVPSEYPIYASGKQFTINDLIQAEMLACKSGQELTFTLIALSHYLDSDATWVADDGETWSIERLIEEELSQPIVGAACGGTHRLMGFSHALRNRRLQGKPISGQWNRAEKFTEDFVRYTYQLQNRDGSMSTNWFEGREDNGDIDRKIQTTGHIVEWLLSVTPDSQLENPRLVQAVRFLLNSFYNDLEHDWSVGPKGHALRSLAIYHQRVFGSVPWQTGTVAGRAGKSTVR